MFRPRRDFLSSSRTTTMYSPTRILSNLSPARSTPSLEHDTLEYYESPPDDYLATPDLSEWKEIRRLEDQKIRKEAEAAVDAQFQYELPSLDILSQNQRPLLSELPSSLPAWPHNTIAPKDAFPDYQEVRRFLQEQARPSSPSASSSTSSSPYFNNMSYHDDYELVPYGVSAFSRSPSADAQHTPSTSSASPVNVLPSPLPSRRVGKKSKREDDEEYEPAPKRRTPAPQSVKGKGRAVSLSDVEDESDNGEENDPDFDGEPADDDGSGDFRPVRRLLQPRRKSQVGARGSSRPTAPARPRAPASRRPVAPPKSKSNRGEDYQEGPCDCQEEKCTNCQMTCFYTFVHGTRKGEVCRRLFESGRHLDLKRHKATHAVQEWKWLQDGEITPEMAYWHFTVFEGKEHGLMCPNGNCMTTFTRYDALKRHMERGTCQFTNSELTKDGIDNRQVKAKIIHESNEKYQRVAAARSVEADKS